MISGVSGICRKECLDDCPEIYLVSWQTGCGVNVCDRIHLQTNFPKIGRIDSFPVFSHKDGRKLQAYCDGTSIMENDTAIIQIIVVFPNYFSE